MTERHTCGGRGATPCPACTARAAQAAFVRAWREQHPLFVSTDGWRCPLCNVVIQVPSADPESDQWQEKDITIHQQEHGDDWSSYEAAGSPGAEGE